MLGNVHILPLIVCMCSCISCYLCICIHLVFLVLVKNVYSIFQIPFFTGQFLNDRETPKY